MECNIGKLLTLIGQSFVVQSLGNALLLALIGVVDLADFLCSFRCERKYVGGISLEEDT